MKKSFFTLLFLLNIFSARADMYAVYDIHVDVTAQNATIAREQGLNDAQEKAFYKMLDRLTMYQDMEALPVLTSEDILNLVQDFSVSDEKTSSVRYIADVDVQFNPEAIQTFFQEYQVPYVTYAAERSVAFPLYKENETAQARLWDDANLWAKALSEVSTTSDLVPFIVPIGDLDDMALVNEAALLTPDILDLKPILSRYQSSGAFVMELSVLKTKNVVKVNIRPLQNEQSVIGELALTEPINAPLPEVLKRAAQRTVYLLEQAWREKNAVRFDNPTKLPVRINIQNLGEWIAYRKRLDKITLIKQYVVKALRRDQAEIEIFYAGSLQAFQDSLKKEDLFLSSFDKNTYLLRDIKDVPLEELNPEPQKTELQQPVADDVILNVQEISDEEIASITAQVEPQTEPIRTFDPVLYQSLDINPETEQMLLEMKQNIQPIDENHKGL